MMETVFKVNKNKKYNNTIYKDTLHKKIVNQIGHCLHCGMEETLNLGKDGKVRSNLHIHHINGVKDDNRKDNITVLCNKCHQSIAHRIIRNPIDGQILGNILNKQITFENIEGKVFLHELD